MFTGLVQCVGVVRSAEAAAGGQAVRLAVAGPTWEFVPGESIAVSGCCLTLAQSGHGTMQFDVVRETLNKTTLGDLKAGSKVNLERSLRLGDMLGGHIVQGHVDGTGTVERVQEGADWRMWVRPGSQLMKYMIPKGSLCLDGVSLTLAEVDPAKGVVGVALIPTTLEVTTLGTLRPGHRVNIEADSTVKTIVHYMEHFGGSRTTTEGRV